MNDTVFGAATLNPESAVLPVGRLVGAYWAETRFEFRRIRRTPALFLPLLLLPAALYLLFAVAIAGKAIAADPAVGVFLFVGFAVLAVTMPALFPICTSLAVDRESGVMRLRRVQPAPAGAWLVAKTASSLAFSVLAYLPVLAAALATGKLTLGFGQLLAMSAALISGAIPFGALGLMLGTLVSGSAAPGYANLIYLPGCYLSGLFFPLPASMHWQVPLWPQFHVNQLAMYAAGIEKFQFVPLQLTIAALTGYTVLFGAIAIWRLAYRP